MSARAFRWAAGTAIFVAHALMFDLGARTGDVWRERHWGDDASRLARLGMSWSSLSRRGVCRADSPAWARGVLARSDALGPEDASVDLAFVSYVLRRCGEDAWLDREHQRRLADAVARCSQVLHVPCDGERFERAADRRFGVDE